MKKFGFFKSKEDKELDKLTSFGPTTISHHIIVKENVKVNGPCSISGILECQEEITINGPLSLSGNISAQELEIRGPFSVKDGKVECSDDVEVKGPLSVNGTIKTNELEVTGPLTLTDGSIECQELEVKGPLNNSGILKIMNVEIKGPYVSSTPVAFGGEVVIYGPVKSNGNLEGTNIEIAGPVNIKGALKAKESIDINLGRSRIRHGPLIFVSEGIEGSIIEISSENNEPVAIEVDITAKEIILRNVSHKGKITGLKQDEKTFLTLIEGASHESTDGDSFEEVKIEEE